MNPFDGLTDEDGLRDLEIQLIEALAAAQEETASLSFAHQLTPAYTARVQYQEAG